MKNDGSLLLQRVAFKTYCRKRKCSSLLKLIEKCENNTSKKVKVSLWCLLFSMTYVATKNISMLRTNKDGLQYFH